MYWMSQYVVTCYNNTGHYAEHLSKMVSVQLLFTARLSSHIWICWASHCSFIMPGLPPLCCNISGLEPNLWTWCPLALRWACSGGLDSPVKLNYGVLHFSKGWQEKSCGALPFCNINCSCFKYAFGIWPIICQAKSVAVISIHAISLVRFFLAAAGAFVLAKKASLGFLRCSEATLDGGHWTFDTSRHPG